MERESGPYEFLGDKVSTIEVANYLRAVPLLSDINDDYLLAIARHGQEIRVNPGDVVVREGDVGSELVVLLEGNVQVQRGGETISTMAPGDYFGELSLLDGQPRSADVVAATPVRALTLDQAAFDQVLMSEPSLNRKIILNLCRMIRNRGPVTR